MSLRTSDRVLLAESGSTGNNTHSATSLGPTETLAFQLVVESVGATPTITWKIQGTIDGTRWYDLGYITDSSDGISTTAITVASPSAGAGSLIFLSNPVARQYQQYRAVTTANTNVTYRIEAYPVNL